MTRTRTIIPAYVVALLVLGAELAAAQERPWCLFQSGPPTRCGFHTLEQCRASIVGGSSHCGPNPAYVANGEKTTGRTWRR
jgi:Protein of unknown function (DUF3551)